MFGNRSEQTSGIETGWDKWEAFEPVAVQVVPTDLPQDSAGTSNEKDLFEGMQPVLTKTTKIQLRPSTSYAEPIPTKKFAVDSTFPPVAAELEEWTEETTSWEAAADELQGELLEQSQKTLREKRAEEREMRRQQQEVLRLQRLQTLHAGSNQLGTKLPNS